MSRGWRYVPEVCIRSCCGCRRAGANRPAAPEATADDSRGSVRPGLEVEAQRSAKLLRALLGACGVAGAMLLALATNSTIINVTIGTTGGDRQRA